MDMIIHEANGVQIGQRPQDGYICLTSMAKANNKRLDKWIKAKNTKLLIAEFERQEQLPPNGGSLFKPALIKIEGRNGGTWAHPDIAIQFAQWCNPSFALQVSRWVRQWLTDEQKPIQSQPQTIEVEKTIAPISDISYAIERLAELERQLTIALAHCKATHGIVEHRIVDLSMNKIIDTIAHQQRNKLESALGQISALRATILAVEKAVAIPQAFEGLVAEIETLRLQKERTEQQLALLKQSFAAKTPQHKVSTLKVVKLQNLSKQERVQRYLDYLETLPEHHTDLNPCNVTNKAISLRLGCEESTVRKVKKDRGIKPRKYQK